MEKEILENTTNSVLTELVNAIFIQKKDFFKRNGRLPDYVMIHVCKKRPILEEANRGNIYGFMGPNNDNTCFGMKVIWTNDIGENNIICTLG